MPPPRRCDLLPEDCAADHICPVLDARPGKDGWAAHCPAHADKKRSLRLALGTKGQPIVWTCHAGCSPGAVRDAMLALDIKPWCIPWRPEKAPQDDRAQRNVLAEIEKLLSEHPNPVDFMIRVAELVWDVDDRTAAQRAGISQATFYRHRARYGRK